ncbi:uncharacterized protein LAESUDRAFT_762130 [Laetiporus sulphureus 93-53]|uniref:FAD-binding domain-containing protein n=1 Tax=Laetiporus sulphureus 93-53 TaxID=1314785 RepID=A0A165CNM8_9APHY|nr:uncharacterized protein LAESUDRAFT_762130 [Laetiporus sulphureus 93-53]KZT03138.1 hypothetical protein LAESUDRAFT_762130 [Laetiporus sulphureus 93-53]
MLHARSLELLSLIGVYDWIADIGVVISFSILQKYVEDALRDAIIEIDKGAVHAPAQLVDYIVSDSPDYLIAASEQLGSERATVHYKYLIGADGGRSTVRLDAVVVTNMSESRRGGVSIESRHHGNVLWTPTDNGRTRIGFVCSDALYGEHSENATAKTGKAVEPLIKGRVFLAGDAAHIHSSGTAQGVTTDVHDATNLAWKLAGVLKGWFPEEILDTHDSERRTSALHLIQLERDIASLMSGEIPAHYNPAPDADVNAYLKQVFNMNFTPTVSLGISYQSL